ncbi:uncharacterized protein BJ171DRAFT_636543, partial [Polychytrium aggregatum]|uniref:uncharacterized protein n=1 Tax=Polychytrium aggregatum TaxID=110093 RepID=UPI0022FEFC0C
EPPVVIWPEWSDSEVNSEKWSTKHVFEDPEGLLCLPRSLRPLLDSYKRPIEFIGDGLAPIAIQPTAMLEDIFMSMTPNSQGSNGLSGISQVRPQRIASARERTAREDGSMPTDSEQPSSQDSGVEALEGDGPEALEEGAPNPTDLSTTNSDPQSTLVANRSDSITSPLQPSPVVSTEEALPPEDEALPTEFSPEQENLSGTSKLFQANRHLMSSELMRQMVATIHYLFDQSKSFKAASLPDEFAPWEQIFPKGKDGLPVYNASGKYIVKLFWLGSWRKITVDDRIPLDSDGRPLLMSSPAVNELWPLLLSKAVVKVAALSYKEIDGEPECGDFDIFYTLKGWIPERLVSQQKSAGFWTSLLNLNTKSMQGNGPVSTAGKPGAGATAMQPAAQKEKAADRSAIASANARANTPRQVPYSVIMAYRDGEVRELWMLDQTCIRGPTDKIDINTIAFSFRVMELRETTPIAVTGKESLKSKPGNEEESGWSDNNDCWMTGTDFIRIFRCVTIYHNQATFKCVRTWHSIPDASKANENLRIPPILYLPDPSREAAVYMCISTYGKIKNESMPSGSSITLEQYDWKLSDRKKPTVRLSTNACLATYVRLPADITAYRFVVDCPTTFFISFLSREDFSLEDEAKYLTERLNLSVKDVDDQFAAQGVGSWFLLFKQALHFNEPTYLAANIYTPDSIQSLTSLRMFDNDTGKLIPEIFYNLHPRIYTPNKSGYTLLADCRTPVARPAGKWKLRLVFEPNTLFSPEKPLEIFTKPSIQDFDDIYVPNKHNILFRFVVKVKDCPENCVSMQLTFAFPLVWIKLQIFENDVEIQSSKGRGITTVYAINMVQGPPDSASKESKSAPGSASSQSKKPKYIVQGSVEQMEFTKFVSVASTVPGDANRPPSRGAKVASAKKKKSTTPASATAATTTVVEDKPQTNEPAWKLRLITADPGSLVVVKDTEKEDRYKAIKDSWEAAQPGRAAKAREARESYLKSTETLSRGMSVFKSNKSTTTKSTPTGRPLTIQSFTEETADESIGTAGTLGVGRLITAESGWTGLSTLPATATPVHVLTPEDLEQREQARQQKWSAFEKIHDEVRRQRAEGKEYRARWKQLQIDKVDEKQKEVDYYRDLDVKRRDSYRQRIIKEMEDAMARKLALEAQRAAELIAEAGGDDMAMQDKDKAKKKVGKR